MITRYRVAHSTVENFNIPSDWVQLDECLPKSVVGEKQESRLWILDISYSEPQKTISTATVGNRDGGIITNQYRLKASVTITFGLYYYETERRQLALQYIHQWANKCKNLITSDREGKVLRNCVCEVFPTIESARNWLDPLTMTFSAYAFPYWEDRKETILAFRGLNQSGTVTFPGTAPEVYVEAIIIPKSNIDGLTVSVKNTKIAIDHAMTPDSRLEITYDENRFIKIWYYPAGASGSSSASNEKAGSYMKYRTKESNDLLIAPCRSAVVCKVETNRTCESKFFARGAWL